MCIVRKTLEKCWSHRNKIQITCRLGFFDRVSETFGILLVLIEPFSEASQEKNVINDVSYHYFHNNFGHHLKQMCYIALLAVFIKEFVNVLA